MSMQHDVLATIVDAVLNISMLNLATRYVFQYVQYIALLKGSLLVKIAMDFLLLAHEAQYEHMF